MVKGVGVDVVEVDRMTKVLEEESSERFLTRVYTALEIEYCQGKAKRIEHLAARFAAKEAVFKALGTGWSGGIGWKDVEIRNDEAGQPHVFLHGKAFEILQERGGGRILLSLSHTSRLAMAQALWVVEECASSGDPH